MSTLAAKFEALATLATQLHQARLAALATLRGTDSLSSINNSIADLKGDPSASLNDIKTQISANGGLQTDANDILTRLIAQFDAAVVTPTMKDLLISIADNTSDIAENTSAIADNTRDIADNTSDAISGMCVNPLSSDGTAYYNFPKFVETFTAATWPENVPDGFTVTTNDDIDRTIVSCADWTKYKIYVESNASMFSVNPLQIQSFKTNQWLTITGMNDLEFFVMGSEKLQVHICGNEIPPEFQLCPGMSGIAMTTGGWTRRYYDVQPPNPQPDPNYYWEMTVYSNTSWNSIDTIHTKPAFGVADVPARNVFIINSPMQGLGIGICVSWINSGHENLRVFEYKYDNVTNEWKSGKISHFNLQDTTNGCTLVYLDTGPDYAYTIFAYTSDGSTPGSEIIIDISDSYITPA